MRWNSTQSLTDKTLTAEQVKTSGWNPGLRDQSNHATQRSSHLTMILAVTASINRLSCDKYTGAIITEPLLPMEQGGVSFINT